MLMASVPASAASSTGYVRNWWVEDNADITWYLLNQDNTVYIAGPCGVGLFRIKVASANYDTAYDSLKSAARNSFRVVLEVTACESGINIIRAVKVCTWIGDC